MSCAAVKRGERERERERRMGCRASEVAAKLVVAVLLVALVQEHIQGKQMRKEGVVWKGGGSYCV